MTEGAEVVDRAGNWRLLDEQQFLRRSLEDAEREHAAGDLSDADYEVLRRRDEGRLAEVEVQLAAVVTAEREAQAATAAVQADGAEVPGPGAEGVGSQGARAEAGAAAAGRRGRRRLRWRRRRSIGLIGAALLAAGAVLLVIELASPRLPGETPTGSIDLSQAQKEAVQLQQAQSLVNGGHPAQALQVYAQVLGEDPKDPVALAEWGWLEWQAGSASKQAAVESAGQAAVAKAVSIEPKLGAAQYYLGTILLDRGQATEAVAHFRAFLADRPTKQWLRDATPAIRTAFADAGQPVPAGVPAASS